MGSIDADSPQYRFYKATEADVPQISELLATVWAKYFSYYVTPQELQLYYDKVSIAAIIKEVQSEHQHFIVATTTTAPDVTVGVVQVTLDSSTPSVSDPTALELQRIYVNGDHHGTGLAQALMRQAEEFVISKGGQSVWLGVWEHNEKGIAFYRKCGFEHVGEKAFYLGTTKRTDYVYLKKLR